MDSVEVEIPCEKESLTFHWADYLVFGVFLVFSSLLGVFVAYRDRKNTSSKQFLTGGGDMHWIPVGLSMQASFLSAIYILSTPIEIYSFGTMYSYLGISYFAGLPIVCYMYLPTFYRLRLVSAYEYLERRFNRNVRVAGSFTFCLMILLYMSVVLYAPAIAIAQVTGLSIYISIPVCGFVCVVYTFLGGMKATIWNDFCQILVIFVGLLVIVIFGAIKVGSLTKIWDINVNGSRIKFNEFNPDPTVRMSFWSLMVGALSVNVMLYASSQTIIQKFLSVKTLNNARKSVLLAAVASFLFLVLVALLGLVMYAYYEQCDPLLSGHVKKADQMVPLFVLEILGPMPGLPGLFIATTFSAALSSLSGSLNALSAVTMYDFVRPAYKKVKGHELNERTCSILLRVLTLVYGIFSIVMGFIAQFLGDYALQIAYSVFGFLGGPVLALLTLGLFFPFVNSWGALAGLFSSFLICSWIAIGTIIAKPPVKLLPRSIAECPVCFANISWTTQQLYTASPTFFDSSTMSALLPVTDVLWVYKISYMYYTVIAIIVAIVVAVPVSLLTGRAQNVDKSLLFQLNCWSSNMNEADEVKKSPMSHENRQSDIDLMNGIVNGGFETSHDIQQRAAQSSSSITTSALSIAEEPPVDYTERL